jgi:hypothetical protein
MIFLGEDTKGVGATASQQGVAQPARVKAAAPSKDIWRKREWMLLTKTSN